MNQETTSGSGPGFGLVGAVTSLGGLSYLLGERFDDEE
jgi:hypothetical protein